MWFLFLLTAVNALLTGEWVNSDFLRFNLGGLPVNIFDVLIVFGLVVSLMPRGDLFFETERPHPALIWVVALFGLALIGAGVGSVGNGANARQISTTARNLAEVPMLIYLGYRLVPRLASAVSICHFLLFVGVVSSVIIMLTFKEQAEDLHGGADVVSVRIIQFVSDYAGIAAALYLFSLGSGAKPLARAWIAVPMAAVCFVGQFTTLSRSDWLALVSGIVAAVAAMPKYRPGKKVLFSMAVTPVIFIVLFVAMLGASSLSGKDVVERVRIRILTMLPGEHEGVKSHAWDTRTSGALAELDLWIHSPLIGRGFGIQDVRAREDGQSNYRHNTWTSTLAESGIIGFAAMALMCFGQVVIGRRMIRDRWDRGSILIGGLGIITGVHFIVLGYCTMSFNQIREAIPVALTFGIVLRCRAIQLATAKQYEGYVSDETLESGGISPIYSDDIDAPVASGY